MAQRQDYKDNKVTVLYAQMMDSKQKVTEFIPPVNFADNESDDDDILKTGIIMPPKKSINSHPAS